MNFVTKPRFWVVVVALAAGVEILHQLWRWEVERVEVGPGEYLVRVHRWGKDLPAGEIVAPDESYKGVMLDVLPEGRYFLNPILWSYEVHKLVQVSPGKCLVLTRKFGQDIDPERLAAGDILASESPDGQGERGILREVKMPGAHRINPYAYAWKEVDAVEVAHHQIGVRTLKVGKDPRSLPADAERSSFVVPAGYRGVQKQTERPGTYYLNPFYETIAPIDVRSHRVELRDIQFPCRDGFILKPIVLVEYAVVPEMAPEVIVRLSDEGKVHQDDATAEQQKHNEVLQKVILPHIRGYARIEGSNFDAKDFIITISAAGEKKAVNNREKLQRALVDKVRPLCRKVGVDVRAVTLADMVPPPELAEQISQRELARVEQEKNKVRLGQYKAEQQLKAAETLKSRSTQKVAVETRLIQAKTQAEQLKEVTELQLKQDLANAQLRLDAARKQAEATLSRGKAEAAVTVLSNEAQVAGLRKMVEGFASVQHFAQYQMIAKLAPALSEIFATDSGEFAKLFTNYLTPPPAGVMRAEK